MTSPAFPELPADLQARLDAASVTDAATLAAALDADPALRREYQAFLLDALPAIPDEEQLRALWQMIPSKDEDAFLAAAEARAAAAETSGDAGLAAALRERIDALRSFQQDIARDGEILRQALERLEAAATDDDLAAVWRDVPLELEETFLNLVALQAEEHEQHGDAERAAHLRACHERFSAIQQQQRAGAETMRRLLEQLAADVEALAAAADHQGVVDVWNRIPLELEESFLQLTEHLAGELEQTDAATAARLRQRIAALSQARVQRETARDLVRQALERLEAASSSDDAWQVWLDLPGDLEEWFLQAITERIEEVERDDTGLAERLRAAHARMRAERNRRQERANHPVVQALRAFLDAATDADATRVFNEHKAILQPFEAQRELDDLAQQAPDEQRAAIAARAALLRRLRGGDPAPRPTPAAVTPAETRRGTPGSIVYINSAVVEGGSGTAIVYNNIVMERRWLRPRPERLSIDTIERTRDLEQVARIITERGQLAITGGTRTATAAVQGMPGIGKTILARQLALALDDRYPGGVIWEEIGPEVRAPEDTQPILNRWARYALTVPPNLDNQLAFDASAVRALFAAQGQPLLVILDNVWSLEAIRWLRAALPENAHLVITTRLETVMIGLGGGEYVLGLLTPDEARALIALRLNWPELPADHYDWADALAVGVGYHTLALDVAIRRLRLDARSPGAPRWREQVERLLSHIRSGQGFERLALPDSERNQNVEAVLAYSYDRMDDTARARFRMLGVFAPEATFGGDAAAALWQCDVEQADDMLSAFAGAALLEAGDAGRWRQHSLLRGYALALLRREGEYDAAAARHAAFYVAAMRTADDAQRFYEVLGDYAQLRHAFAWAIKNDLELAQDLIANTANLQRAHGYGRDNLAWAEQALAAAQQRGTPAQVARARVALGNALQHAAGLPGEDRGARLREALAAYDAALRIYTAETVPLDYAMTQNNRAVLLRDLASVPGEDRGARLREALAAYDAALRYRTPETVPLDYAMTQNNRANLLRDLASVPGEDRGARLREALAAYDAALRYRTPETVPLDYAMTQNNRAVLLSDLASVPGEDRGARLREALAAYDAALRYRTPETVPLDYAATQNNRANLLSDLASVPGEDRGARLREALAAYDAALRYRTPETVPLDYAATQNNRANLLSDLASVPGEDRGARLREALAAYDAALRIYTAETVPLAYAATQNNRAVLLSDLASVPGEDRGARLREALAAYDAALRYRTPETVPLDYAMTQNNRANLLRDLASVPGEDRGARLREALAAYDAALRYRTPETVPLDYAMTQNNRAVLLSDLASVPGEDRGARLREALAACDAALRYRTPETVPLDYAATQNNRANLLRDLASVPGEDRAARLRQALSAYDEALRFYTPTSAPLAYATTQNNRGAVLQDLATLAEEDRAARLRQALSAYDEALRFVTPTSAPLGYAMTQGNLLNLYQTLAGEPGEDRMSRLLDALRAGWTAFRFFTALQHSDFQQRVMHLLRGLRAACGDDFDTLWAALDAGPPPGWLIAPEEGETLALLSQLIQRLLAVSSGDELLAFWRELPAELEEPLAAAAEEAARQSGQAGDAALAQALRERAAGLRAIRAAADAAQSIQQAWQRYIELVKAAEASGNDIAAWRAAVEAGEALLAPEFTDTLGIGDAVREHVASTWNALGNALHNAGDKDAAIAAYDRAIALQPDQAMWRRNRVATLIDLGRRAEAAEELARARALEPDAARLTELEARLRDEG
jgi:protein-arginine kinase activator protein McsA